MSARDAVREGAPRLQVPSRPGEGIRSDAARCTCRGSNWYGMLGIGTARGQASDHRGNDPAGMGDNLPVVDLGTDAQGRAVWVRAVTVGSESACALIRHVDANAQQRGKVK